MSQGQGLESLIPKQNPQNHGGDAGDNQPKENSLSQKEATFSLGSNFREALSNIQVSRPTEDSLPRRTPAAGEAVFQIEVEKITPNPHQPRRQFDEETLKELASSIREFGIIQPLVVSKLEKETESGQEVWYQLIAGERRLLAAKMAGLERVPVIIRELDEEKQGLELAIIENLQREDLNPIEAARAFSRLQDQFKLTQREIAARLGKSREGIANTMRLLNLPSHMQEALEKNQLSESQGRLLLAVTDIKSQDRLFEEILKNSLSVREIRSRIRTASPQNEETKPALAAVSPELHDFKDKLQTFLGAPVEVKQNGPSGKIIINFYSAEELKNIIAKVVADEGREQEHGEEPEDSSDFTV